MPADQNPTQEGSRRTILYCNIIEIATSKKRHPHCVVLPRRMRSVPRTSKPVLGCFVATFALLAANRAQGATGGTGGTGTGGTVGTPTLSDFTAYFEKYDNGNWARMNATSEQPYFFNRARCECDTDKKAEVKIVIVPGTSAATKISTSLAANYAATGGSGRLYAGNNSINCLVPSTYSSSNGLAANCTNLLNPTLAGYTDSFLMTVSRTSCAWATTPGSPG